jgi:hypothetical protein
VGFSGFIDETDGLESLEIRYLRPLSPPVPVAAGQWPAVGEHRAYGLMCVAARGIRGGSYYAATTGPARCCDGDSSAGSNDHGNAVAGREPCFATAVDRHCHSERTGGHGGRNCL